MTPEARKQAAQYFWQHLDSGELIAELPVAQRPKSEAEGHAIQATFAEHSSQPVAGWKIASSSKAGQEHLNVDGPLACLLYTSPSPRDKRQSRMPCCA